MTNPEPAVDSVHGTLLNWRLLLPLGVFSILVPLEVLCRHLSFGTSAWDLGIYHQALSQLSRFSTANPFITVHQQRIFNDHFDPILFLLTPVFRIRDNALILPAFDYLFTVFGLVPLVLLAHEKTRSWKDTAPRRTVIATVVWAYLFNDFLWNALFFPSHPTHWGVTFLAWVLYFYERERFRAGFWISLVLLFACKEEYPFLGVMLASAIAWKGRWRLSVGVFVLAGAFLIFAFLVRPMLWGQTVNHGHFLGVMVSDPMGYMHQWGRTVADRRFFIPVVLLATYFLICGLRRSRDLLLIMSAPFLIRSLSLYRDAFSFHYAAVFLPFVMLAFLRSAEAPRVESAGLKRLCYAVILLGVLGLAARPSPFHHPLSSTLRYIEDRPRYRLRDRVVERLSDPQLRISAPNNWVPHLTDHAEVTMPSVWLENGGASTVDAWIWDRRGDYYPAKRGEDELRGDALRQIGGEGSIVKEMIGDGVELWLRPGKQ